MKNRPKKSVVMCHLNTTIFSMIFRFANICDSIFSITLFSMVFFLKFLLHIMYGHEFERENYFSNVT